MRAKRVLIVTHSYYLRDTRPRRHATALAGDGWGVDVLCARDEGERWRERAGDVTVWRLPARRKRGSKYRYVFEYASFGLMCFLAVAIMHAWRRYRVVYVFSIPNILVLAAAVPKLLGARVFLDVRDPMPEFFQSKYGLAETDPLVRALRAEERLACRFASRVVTVHEPMRELLARTGRTDIDVVLNAPDLGILTCPENVTRDPADRTVLYAGTVATRYGVDVLVEALARLKDEIPALRVKIVGDGDAVPMLKQRARALGVEDRLDLPGPVPLTEMAAIIARAWVGAQPHRDDELMHYCFSTKILEWGALGLPVVCAKTPAFTASFGDDEIRYIRPADLDELCAALREIHADPEAAAARAARLKRAVQRFDWSSEKRQLLTALSRP